MTKYYFKIKPFFNVFFEFQIGKQKMISPNTISYTQNKDSAEPLQNIESDNKNRSNSSSQKFDFSNPSPNHSIHDSQLNVQPHRVTDGINAISESNQNNNDIFLDINDDDKIAANEIQLSLFAQIAHISEFLANAEENLSNRKSNPCFQMLSDFFEVFNEQLRINFKIRNKLNEERKRNPVDPKKVNEKKNEIDNFLREFKEIISKSKNNHSDIIDPRNIEKSFNNVITIIQNGVKKTAKLKKLIKEIENKKEEIANINNEILANEKMLQDTKSNSENRTISIQKQINESKEQIIKQRSQIDEILPRISNLKTQIQNESALRQQLSEMITKRKNQIEIAHQSFTEEQNKQMKKLHKLGVKLSKLKIERRQLLIDEQPLISALEDAEQELKEAKSAADKQINSLNKEKNEIVAKLDELTKQLTEIQMKKEKIISIHQQKKEEVSDCSIEFNEINEKINVLKNKIAQIDRIKKDMLHKLNQKSSTVRNKVQNSPNNNRRKNINSDDDDNENNNIQIESNNNFNLEFQEIDDIILNSISDEINHLEDSSVQYKNRIEEIRKENSKIRSMIRVKKEKIAKLIEENQNIQASNSLYQKEVDKLTIDARAQKQRYSLFKSTMNEYERMRKALGFHSSMLPSEVAKHAVSMIKSWKQVEYDEVKANELNGKITCNTINEEFEYIFDELNDVESKLYGTNQ